MHTLPLAMALTVLVMATGLLSACADGTVAPTYTATPGPNHSEKPTPSVTSR